MFNLPEPSCPRGYTGRDLETVFGEEGLQAFREFMAFQTAGFCDGRTYHHNRAHGGFCRLPASEGGAGHHDGDGFGWQCDYTGTGYYEDTECAGAPHGVVTYRHDVLRWVEHTTKGTRLIWD
jgi:hypothetical protein